MRAPRPVAAVLASATSLCLLAVAACSGSSSRRLIPPPPTTVALATTAPGGSDFTGIALTPVEGKAPTEEVEILGGEATLSGLVTGPDGPVAGATVRLERFVGDAMGRIDVVTGGDGRWRAPQPAAPPPVPTVPSVPLLPGQLPTIPPPTTAPPPPPVVNPTGPQGIHGGRYRVRAWRTPDLALTTPQILFVEGKENRNLGLQLSRYTGTSASAVSSPDPPILNGFVSVTAVVTTAGVDGEGIVRGVPLANATVALSVGPEWELTGGASITNAAGRATFQLRCLALGQSPVELTVNNSQSFTLPIRACVAPAPTTTSTLVTDPGASTSSSSSIPGDDTSTTRGGPSTT